MFMTSAALLGRAVGRLSLTLPEDDTEIARGVELMLMMSGAIDSQN